MDVSLGPINSAGLTHHSSPKSTSETVSHSSRVSPAANLPQGDSFTPSSTASSHDVYAVSDTKFTLYKDAAGKLITRYVSLRDGTVTYTPTPTVVKPLTPPIAINV